MDTFWTKSWSDRNKSVYWMSTLPGKVKKFYEMNRLAIASQANYASMLEAKYGDPVF